MTDERSKYDTDPLDPDFVRRTGEVSAATRDMRRTPVERARQHEGADAPTRLFQDERDSFAAPYPSVFASPEERSVGDPQLSDPARSAPAWESDMHERGAPTTRVSYAQQQQEPPSARVVRGIGLPENLLAIAPYAPLFLGAIAAVVELLLVPRDERKTRFHAAQGLALHGAVLAGALLLRFARTLAVFAFGGFASGLLQLVWLGFCLATVIFFVKAMVRVHRGEGFRVEAADEAARWLDNKIAPRT